MKVVYKLNIPRARGAIAEIDAPYGIRIVVGKDEFNIRGLEDGTVSVTLESASMNSSVAVRPVAGNSVNLFAVKP